jgi:hypothetical protein
MISQGRRGEGGGAQTFVHQRNDDNTKRQAPKTWTTAHAHAGDKNLNPTPVGDGLGVHPRRAYSKGVGRRVEVTHKRDVV